MTTTDKLAEALRNLLELAGYWFDREDKRGFSEDQYRAWHALGFGSNTVLNARKALRQYEQAKAQPAELPPLPEPHTKEGVERAPTFQPLFTADQMREYARAALAATPAARAQVQNTGGE